MNYLNHCVLASAIRKSCTGPKDRFCCATDTALPICRFWRCRLSKSKRFVRENRGKFGRKAAQKSVGLRWMTLSWMTPAHGVP
jgi:hypothetical protein